MGLSFFIILFLLIFGATAFAFKAFFVGLWDYLLALPRMSVEIWSNDGSETGKALANWQGGIHRHNYSQQSMLC